MLIKRTKPGRDTYWTTPGGGSEESDATPEAVLHRELAEELGATVSAELGWSGEGMRENRWGSQGHS